MLNTVARAFIFMIPFAIIAFFIIANQIPPTTGRQLKSFFLDEISATAFNAIQSAAEKYNSLEILKKFSLDAQALKM